MSWPRNLSLLRPPQANSPSVWNELDDRYGHRVVYIPGFRCPSQNCPADNGGAWAACDLCAGPANLFKMLYGPPPEEDYEGELRRPAPGDPPQNELLEHRWLVSEPVVTDETGKTYTYLTDFILDGRKLIWLNAKGPSGGATYKIKYRALKEDRVALVHAMAGPQGGPLRAERGVVLPSAFLPQGVLAISIPPDASCFLPQSGDLFLIADAADRFQQTVDPTLPSRRSHHRWVIRVVYAFWHRRLPGGGFERIEVTDKVDYDFQNHNWLLDESLENGAAGPVSITYDAAPIYTLNMDIGESRSPALGAQPRLALLIRTEVFY